MLDLSGVYRIENITNKRIYIGKSTSIFRRWADHYKELSTNKHCNLALLGDFALYGYRNFKFSIIELCDKRMLAERENYYINRYRMEGYSLYNFNKLIYHKKE
jgi:group I intron endonuclease